MGRALPEFDGSRVEAMRAVDRCKAILQSLCGNRERLLESVLGGKHDFRLKVFGLTQGLPVDDSMIEAMWGYISFRQGPCPREEYERCLEQRQAKENQERAERETLDELAALAHGKNREEEAAKILKVNPSPELARLPELAKI